MKKKSLQRLLAWLAATGWLSAPAQMITGTWHGKINGQRVEVKLIQSGDSLRGTSYYYSSPENYRRYSIQGYFDQQTNSAVWWDDQLIEEKAGRLALGAPGRQPRLSRADFDCPGSGVMRLDGKGAPRSREATPDGDVHLDKSGPTRFPDEWDDVIDNYLTGANDPDLIDSVAALAVHRTQTGNPAPQTLPDQTGPDRGKSQPPVERAAAGDPLAFAPPVRPQVSEPVKTSPVALPKTPAGIREKFASRERVLVREIPLTGDSLELRFYDNAEVDGDSISLFLNDRILAEHIRLTEKAYILRLAVASLPSPCDLTMVAENLGAIPPNTSYMVALVGDKRYEAYLASTEGSSAMIRLVRQPGRPPGESRTEK
ncbi:MAG TPA: hypothetical protein VG870_04495 [Chitinophagaceae bacterium]|nr:hypothetical protein [Chitinophagaceae bacterium]